jgi:hypothetical protein
MSYELVIALFAIATGFVSAGLLASLYQLVTAEPVRFEAAGDTLFRGVAMIIMLMFAGPMVLMRNALRGRLIERRPVGWLVASTAISASWSLCSGIVVMELALAIQNSLS